MADQVTASVLERLLEPISRSLNLQSARALAEIKSDPVAQKRIAELAEKCNQGALTPIEEKEYETYVNAGSLIAILQAKARAVLARHRAKK